MLSTCARDRTDPKGGRSPKNLFCECRFDRSETPCHRLITTVEEQGWGHLNWSGWLTRLVDALMLERNNKWTISRVKSVQPPNFSPA